MTSQIDVTKPVFGNPTTQSERANWQTAANEISVLQANTQGAPFLPLAGARMTGPMYLYNDPTDAMMPATKGYVDAGGGGGGGGIPEAPADGSFYGRGSGAWHPVIKIDGDTMTGLLILSGDPTDPLGAVTKQYADAIEAATLPDAPNNVNAYGRYQASWTPVLPLTGGEISGSLGINQAIPSPAPSLATLFTGYVTTANLGINVYPVGAAGTRIAAGPAAVLNANNTTNVIDFYVAATGAAGSAIASLIPALTFGTQIGSIWMNGAPQIPTDSTDAVFSAPDFTTVGHYAHNCYVGAGPAWKALQAGYSANHYLNQGNGAWALTLYASAAAGANISTTATMTFDQGGNLVVPLVRTTNMSPSSYNGYEWQFYTDGSGNHIQNHRAQWYDMWNSSSGLRSWYSPSAQCMTLDGSGNLVVVGNISGANVSVSGQVAGGFGMAMASNGSTYTYQFTTQPSYIQYEGPTGNITNYVSGNLWWLQQWSTNMVGDQRGAVFGYGAYVNYCDARSKTEIAPATYGMAEVRQLQPIAFKRRAPDTLNAESMPPQEVQRTEIGFIAQDVREVVREAVFILPDNNGITGPMGVAEGMLLAVVVNAVKELDTRLSALEGTRH